MHFEIHHGFICVQVKTHSMRKAHENIDKTLKFADAILIQFELTKQVAFRISSIYDLSCRFTLSDFENPPKKCLYSECVGGGCDSERSTRRFAELSRSSWSAENHRSIF